MSFELDFQSGVVKYIPPAAGVGADVAARFAGLSLSDWFYIAIITYTLAQTAVLLMKTWADIRKKQEDKDKDKEG